MGSPKRSAWPGSPTEELGRWSSRPPRRERESGIRLRVLCSTSYVLIRMLEQDVVLLQRSALRLPDREPELHQVYRGMVAALPARRAKLDLIVDSRLAAGRNDELFETVQATYRDRLFGGFRSVVALVDTPTGRLQVERYRAARPAGMIVLDDLDTALELLRDYRRSRPPSG